MTDDAERTCAGMNLHGKDIKIFAGNSNKPLAAAMAECLGITLGRSEVGRFSDGEIQVSIQESVRGSDVYVVQSTSSPVSYTHLSCSRCGGARSPRQKGG